MEYDFHALCTPHYQALVNYANRLLPGRPQEALDLVQGAYLRAIRCWSKWQPADGEDAACAARGWLHRIVQNLFFDESRAHSGHRKLLGDHHDVVISQTYGVETDHNIQILSDGVGDEVRQALSELDQDHRDVVEHVDFGGETYLAAAESLGIPLGTVMSRLHRGRKRLAATLRSYAKCEYGISKKEIVVKGPTRRRLAVGTESDCSGAAALADVPTKLEESEPDGVDGVVAGYNDGEFLQR